METEKDTKSNEAPTRSESAGLRGSNCSPPWSFVEHTWAETTVYDANDLAVCHFSIREGATEENQEVLEKRMDDQARLVVKAPTMMEALRAIKLEALTCQDGARGLAHIIRLCIDAGVKEKLDELEANAKDLPPANQTENQS